LKIGDCSPAARKRDGRLKRDGAFFKASPGKKNDNRKLLRGINREREITIVQTSTKYGFLFSIHAEQRRGSVLGPNHERSRNRPFEFDELCDFGR
jgi:hypothetical protein